MSTRFYPLYQKGNPQLRVFLPNFWMKMVRCDEPLPPNFVMFHASKEMTHHDIKNYLEKIYNIPVAEVKAAVKNGKLYLCRKKYVAKEEDYKEALVKLPKDTKFTFPDICKEMDKQESKRLKEAKENYSVHKQKNIHRPGVPGWFAL